MTDPLLKVEGLRKSFGGLQALKNVSFALNSKEVIGLIGPNGCGKSTTFNVISGIYPADSGSVKLKGEEILNKKPHEINRLGLSRTFQYTQLWRNLTVIENLLVPPKNQTGAQFVNILRRLKLAKEEEILVEKAYRTLELLEISHVAENYASELSGGQSKLVDIGRVLMSDPTILLLDEPVAGVAGPLAQKIFDQLQKLRKSLGLSIVIIEHNMEFILRKGIDRIYVMNLGEVIAEGTSDEIASMPHVIEAYLGG